MRKTKKLRKIIAIILIIATIAYIAYAVMLLLINPTDVYILTQGELLEEDETVGYIIRDEQVIENDENSSGIYVIAKEGQKVAKDETVFRYYKDSENEITDKITELNYQIQEKLETEKNISSTDIKLIENQIEDKLIQLSYLTNYQEIKEYKNSIDSLISEKIKYIGELTENSEIKALISQRENYEKQLTDGASYKTAPISGIVSYRVDGLENELTPSNFSNITEDYLESLELKTGQIIPSSDEYGKIIDNFKCYVAVVINTEQANEAEVGDTVTLSIANEEEVSAEIVQINEETENRVIIFELTKITENMINYRKVEVNIIWWKKTGYKVPNQAIITENVDGTELNYIIRSKSGTQSKILVRIEKQNEKFSIISSYSSEELQELGFDTTYIRNYQKISNYDEIVLNVQE